MLFSAAAESCIRVLVFLAQHPAEEQFRVSDIARAEKLPLPYLAKRCQELARLGFIETTRGRRGGIRLAHRPEELKLGAVIAGLQAGERFKACILGHPECSEQTPCPLHETWKPLRAVLLDALGSKTLADLAGALAKKRRSGRKR
jgi:Rrf2 family protein